MVAFSGSRHGLSSRQHSALWHLLRVLFGKGERRACVGCCKGADLAFALLADSLAMHLTGRPGDLRDWVSPQALALCDRVHLPRPSLERNARIVAEATPSGYLLACPAEGSRGTWHAIGLARRAGLAVAVIFPDGSYAPERWPG